MIYVITQGLAYAGKNSMSIRQKAFKKEQKKRESSQTPNLH